MDLNFTLVFSSCTLNYDKNTVKKLGIQGFELLKKADNLCFQHGYPIIYLFSSRLILDAEIGICGSKKPDTLPKKATVYKQISTDNL